MELYRSDSRYSFAEGKKGRCWSGYEPVPGKEPYSDGSCRKKTYTENVRNVVSSYAEKKKKDKGKDKGKVGVIQRSDAKDKKFKTVTPEGKTIHFGHEDYDINVRRDGGEKGSKSDNYCSRSNGIKKTPRNIAARATWGCVGDKAYPSKAKKIGDKINF